MAELPWYWLARGSNSETVGESHNLALFKRLLHLLQVGQVADIGANALSSRAEGADGIGNPEINLQIVST